jgi:hypothetical protein
MLGAAGSWFSEDWQLTSVFAEFDRQAQYLLDSADRCHKKLKT